MVLLITIFITLLIVQILFGIASAIHKRKLPQRYAHILTALPDPANTLERYIRIYRSVNLRVNAQIEEPALAQNDFILLKRDHMYNQDLYTNFFLLAQLELTKKMYRFLRELYMFQNIFFISGIITFVAGLGFDSEYSYYFVAVAVALHVLTIFLSTIAFFLYEFMLEEVILIANDLLDLDELEHVRAQQLATDFKYRVFEYPIDIPVRLLYFFKP